jgi:hypothetical protein
VARVLSDSWCTRRERLLFTTSDAKPSNLRSEAPPPFRNAAGSVKALGNCYIRPSVAEVHFSLFPDVCVLFFREIVDRDRGLTYHMSSWTRPDSRSGAEVKPKRGEGSTRAGGDMETRVVLETFSASWLGPATSNNHVEPVWGLCTHAIRRLAKYFHQFDPSHYSYRECVTHARSPLRDVDRCQQDVRLDLCNRSRGSDNLSTLRWGWHYGLAAPPRFDYQFGNSCARQKTLLLLSSYEKKP